MEAAEYCFYFRTTLARERYAVYRNDDVTVAHSCIRRWPCFDAANNDLLRVFEHERFKTRVIQAQVCWVMRLLEHAAHDAIRGEYHLCNLSFSGTQRNEPPIVQHSEAIITQYVCHTRTCCGHRKRLMATKYAEHHISGSLRPESLGSVAERMDSSLIDGDQNIARPDPGSRGRRFVPHGRNKDRA